MREYRWIEVPLSEGSEETREKAYHLNCGAETIAIISKAPEVDKWKYEIGYKTTFHSTGLIYPDTLEKAKLWVEVYLKDHTDFSKDCTIVE